MSERLIVNPGLLAELFCDASRASPTYISAVFSMPAFLALAAISFRLPLTIFWSGHEAFSTTAQGVVDG